MSPGGVPDVVGAVTGVYGERERQRRDSPAHAGEMMLIWNELQIGDLIDVDADYNFYPKVRIIQKVDDVALESGLPPGPGFIGKEANGDEIVFSVDEVDPASYEKYALAERKIMKVTQRQLKRIIKEEKTKLLREIRGGGRSPKKLPESHRLRLRKIFKTKRARPMNETVADMRDMEEAVYVLSQTFAEMMLRLFEEDPEMFEGRSTKEEWDQQVSAATDELEQTLGAAVERVETMLHDGQYHTGPHKPF